MDEPPRDPPTDKGWLEMEHTRGTFLALAADGMWVTPDHLCPDLLRLSSIGAADGMRGRVVRAFFWLMRLWPTPTS